ncbi:MAG TPA: secretin N-terminal domain-containing protein, partial [bacterium]|nr:secretin N-terminal domain-containing protein [bacterium]
IIIIIIENSIKQDVTINLKNIEFERGMNTFLEIYGLKLLKYDNIYKIIKDNEGFKIPVTVRNNLVTADIRNGDLETALRQISAQTGYSLVLFKDIKSKINIQLKNTVLNEALEYLLKNTPLTYKFDDNQKILFIGSPAAEQNESDLFNKRITYKLNHYPVKQLLNILPKSFSAANMKYLSEINSVILTATEDVHNEFAKFLNIIDKQNDQKIFPLKYIEAKDFLSLLPSNLPDYSMKIIDEQNAVFVSGTPEMLEKMQNMINILDVKPAQIMIEILVAEISDEAKKELGLNALETKDNKISAIYAPLTGTSFTYNSVTRLSKEFSITLAALENRGLVEVKASPKIATKSGKQASIIVGREENFRITIPSANASVPLNQVEKIPSGIFLKIRPWSSINSDQINVDIHTEVSSSSGQASASELPTISKKTASTNLILKEGETVIIGGLKTIDKTNATEQIPLIGSIPVFGKFFSKSSKRNKETELTFFITPRIIKNIEGVDNNAE